MGCMSMSGPGGRTRGHRAGVAALAVSLAALAGVTACTSGSAAVTGTGTGPTQASSAPAASSGSASSAGSVIPANSTLQWHSCSGQLAQEGVPDCTMLSVPLNYADPGGRHISLALDMVPATAPQSQQQGVMLVNPGGPGGDGLPLAAEVGQGINPGVAADYDLGGFDPAGRSVLGARPDLRPKLFQRRH